MREVLQQIFNRHKANNELADQARELVNRYDAMVADENADQVEGSIAFAGDAYDLLRAIVDANTLKGVRND